MILRDTPYGVPSSLRQKASADKQAERKNKSFSLFTINKIALILFILSLSKDALASPGCMDNSWHMTRPFDAKEYHIVTHQVGKHKTFCPCPCRKLSLNRGECLECGHRHDMQPWIIIRAPKKQKTDIAPAA